MSGHVSRWTAAVWRQAHEQVQHRWVVRSAQASDRIPAWGGGKPGGSTAWVVASRNVVQYAWVHVLNNHQSVTGVVYGEYLDYHLPAQGWRSPLLASLSPTAPHWSYWGSMQRSAHLLMSLQSGWEHLGWRWECCHLLRKHRGNRDQCDCKHLRLRRSCCCWRCCSTCTEDR